MDVKAEVFAGPERQARHAALHGPLWWDDRFDGWAVTSYALVDHVLRAHEVFSSRELEVGPSAPHADNPVLRSLLALDPPEHHRLRRIVGQAFTPRAIDRAQAVIEHAAGELVRSLPPDPDVVGGFAVPLTTAMLAGLLGIPDDRGPDFVRWTHVLAAFIGPAAADPDRRAEFSGVVDDMERFLRRTSTSDAPAPGSVLARLQLARAAGELGERELIDFLILLIVAGHETTTTLVTRAALCLERFPEQPDALRAGTVTEAAFLEEVLRLLPPTGGADRFTTEATTLAGRAIGPGQRVVALIGPANRDPTVFADPDRFDPTRDHRSHLGFGRGVHACLGAHLARREARIALRHLLRHVPGRWHLPVEDIASTTTPVGIDIHRLRVVGGHST